MSHPVPRKDEHPKDFFDSTWESLGTARGVSWLMTTVFGAGAFFVWLLSVSELLAGVLLGLCCASLFLAFLAKAKHDGEVPNLSLSELTVVSVVGDGEKPTAKDVLSRASSKPQPNIIMAGQPRITSVIWDTNYVFHENRVSPKSRRALVVDFRNELEQGKEIKSLESVKSQLTYSYNQAPAVSHHVNRGFWLDHEYTHTDFQRGDTRTLLIGLIIPDPDGRDALQVYENNKRESENDPIQQPGTITFGKYDCLTIKVALFTQTRHRFHKECEFELDKDGRRQITKPFA